MRIIFVRHGDPNYKDDCLTPLGHIQAKAAAERLRDEGIEEIYSSPYGRAMETAAYTSEVLGLPVKVLDYMHELNWGSIDGEPTPFKGHPWAIADALANEGFDLTDKNWAEHPYFKNNRVVESAANVERGIDEWMASLGYIREGVYYRCVREDDEQHTVALFSHGGSSAAAMGRIMNLPFPDMCAMLHLPFTSATIIRMDRRPGSLHLPVLELAGDGRHINGLTL